MLSGDITDDKNLLANASGLRFFTNAVNTETQGFDFKLNHHIAFETHGDWRSGVWLHYAENKITRFNGNIITSANSLSEINRIEQGQPQSALRWLNSYEYKQVTTTLNITRHGEYHDYFDNQLYRFDARWITDLDISVRLRKTLSLSIGAHNLFDSTPNKWKNLTDNNQVWGDNGFIYYSRYSPFGFSGAYYYATARLIF
jgi:iron complex outermembrane receptor protein